MKELYEELIKTIIKKKLNLKQTLKLRRKLCRKYHPNQLPSITQILLNAKPSQIKHLKHLITKPTRTISGVSVVAIMTKPIKCSHGKCIMCPGGPKSFFGNLPQSYTGNEPATMRAIRNNYDPYLQVFNRLEQYIVLDHLPDKVELILMGGTFPSFPKKYQEEFVKYALKALNDFGKLFFKNNSLNLKKFKEFFELPSDIQNKERTKRIHKKILKLKGKTTLEKEQKRNEKAFVRNIGTTIETRSDYAKLSHCNQMLKLGCTRVELGIQSIYNEQLKKIKRGHTIEDSIKAMKTLKDLGFKINAHYMLGLPESTPKKDLDGLKILFSDERFKPDMLKIYPCIVLKGTKLYNLYKKKKFNPITFEQVIKILSEFKKNIPPYLRIMRIQRDISQKVIEAGIKRTNLRQYINQKCNCIRCREVGRHKKYNKPSLKVLEYKASKGKEFFISFEDKNNILFGFCRLRIPSKTLRKEITKETAIIRELHVYGPSTQIGKKGKIQHKGLGKQLVKKAEEIAKQYKMKKMIIISGIGVKEYYSTKLSYKRNGPYMVKKL